MSVVWNCCGNFHQALRCISQCKQLYEKYFGERHPGYLASLKRLGFALLLIKDHS